YLIYRNAIAEKFITTFLAIYNRKTCELRYVNAGHNAPVLLFENDSYRLLNEGCTMLGVFDILPFMSVTEVHVPPKSVVLLYTDGLTEVFNSEEDEYGIESTIHFLRRSRYMSSKTLHKQLLNEIDEFNVGKNFSDDITLLSCRFK
ncbi:MAG: serine/threonine-protein phosphatase, partial [Hymenobacteraceae bacterium]|nr:serine/threonine-protein phosphatase [Hymenobacteraceae bacterium]MDX5396591.1 serine/threonine-protein phosphatase [Hymenobacteraceae bacterium]MDX5512654.1 serine/threonine-protein phosphatase [Hymenobacteraceae bacterium]